MNPLKLSGNLRLQDAPGLIERLEAALATGDVEVDASELAGADAAVVQVLLSAARSASMTGRTLSLQCAGSPLAAQLEALGIAPDGVGA
ncbi:STAS domain-containing protein [Cereibacter azotoformans]|uniref:STAS domain-containing protein n=1 Tax=Cereibacter azotoformans TaxID=43057 RepID=A0A2T5KER1_9RHOB|nr:STAS domain-containing protein [Cereibacter azotoformans]AXQ92536.1 STAS domain-containing protein [Cereibacter sphaeroides]MBO4169886.1 STAS domain-containing protein [Cereibacter azotoformans]PTR20852.1 STAS domain-containing protein [Cereibacter azotoformans]UIJ30811.1 STAS domain-containing protein [Cereibacter azotoformans]